jgi:hypothetical protein
VAQEAEGSGDSSTAEYSTAEESTAQVSTAQDLIAQDSSAEDLTALDSIADDLPTEAEPNLGMTRICAGQPCLLCQEDGLQVSVRSRVENFEYLLIVYIGRVGKFLARLSCRGHLSCLSSHASHD